MERLARKIITLIFNLFFLVIFGLPPVEVMADLGSPDQSSLAQPLSADQSSSAKSLLPDPSGLAPFGVVRSETFTQAMQKGGSLYGVAVAQVVAGSNWSGQIKQQQVCVILAADRSVRCFGSDTSASQSIPANLPGGEAILADKSADGVGNLPGGGDNLLGGGAGQTGGGGSKGSDNAKRDPAAGQGGDNAAAIGNGAAISDMAKNAGLVGSPVFQDAGVGCGDGQPLDPVTLVLQYGLTEDAINPAGMSGPPTVLFSDSQLCQDASSALGDRFWFDRFQMLRWIDPTQPVRTRIVLSDGSFVLCDDHPSPEGIDQLSTQNVDIAVNPPVVDPTNPDWVSPVHWLSVCASAPSFADDLTQYDADSHRTAYDTLTIDPFGYDPANFNAIQQNYDSLASYLSSSDRTPVKLALNDFIEQPEAFSGGASTYLQYLARNPSDLSDPSACYAASYDPSLSFLKTTAALSQMPIPITFLRINPQAPWVSGTTTGLPDQSMCSSFGSKWVVPDSSMVDPDAVCCAAGYNRSFSGDPILLADGSAVDCTSSPPQVLPSDKVSSSALASTQTQSTVLCSNYTDFLSEWQAMGGAGNWGPMDGSIEANFANQWFKNQASLVAQAISKFYDTQSQNAAGIDPNSIDPSSRYLKVPPVLMKITSPLTSDNFYQDQDPCSTAFGDGWALASYPQVDPNLVCALAQSSPDYQNFVDYLQFAGGSQTQCNAFSTATRNQAAILGPITQVYTPPPARAVCDGSQAYYLAQAQQAQFNPNSNDPNDETTQSYLDSYSKWWGVVTNDGTVAIVSPQEKAQQQEMQSPTLSSASVASPRPMNGMIASSHGLSCTIAHDYVDDPATYSGPLTCWGDLTSNDGSKFPPMMHQSQEHYDSVAIGKNNVCAIRSSDQRIRCNDRDAQHKSSINIPAVVSADVDATATNPTPLAPRHFISVKVGEKFACALERDAKTQGPGVVSCWRSGQDKIDWVKSLPFPDEDTGLKRSVCDNDPQCAPAPIVNQEVDVVNITASSRHVCAVTSGGNLFCWGELGSYDKYDLPLQGVTAVPLTHVPGVIQGHVTDVSMGEGVICALLDSSQVECWGRGDPAALGWLNLTPALDPTGVPVNYFADSFAKNPEFSKSGGSLDDLTQEVQGQMLAPGADPSNSTGSTLAVDVTSHNICLLLSKGDAPGEQSVRCWANKNLLLNQGVIQVPMRWMNLASKGALPIPIGQLVNGGDAVFMFMQDGSVEFWGSNVNVPALVRVPNHLTNEVHIAISNTNFPHIDKVQLDASGNPILAPLPLASPDSGNVTGCAILDRSPSLGGGKIHCWAQGRPSSIIYDGNVDKNPGATQVAVAGLNVCWIDNQMDLKCSNMSAAYLNPPVSPINLSSLRANDRHFYQVVGLRNSQSVAPATNDLSEDQFCALTVSGTVLCWTMNLSGSNLTALKLGSPTDLSNAATNDSGSDSFAWEIAAGQWSYLRNSNSWPAIIKPFLMKGFCALVGNKRDLTCWNAYVSPRLGGRQPGISREDMLSANPDADKAAGWSDNYTIVANPPVDDYWISASAIKDSIFMPGGGSVCVNHHFRGEKGNSTRCTPYWDTYNRADLVNSYDRTTPGLRISTDFQSNWANDGLNTWLSSFADARALVTMGPVMAGDGGLVPYQRTTSDICAMDFDKGEGVLRCAQTLNRDPNALSSPPSVTEWSSPPFVSRGISEIAGDDLRVCVLDKFDKISCFGQYDDSAENNNLLPEKAKSSPETLCYGAGGKWVNRSGNGRSDGQPEPFMCKFTAPEALPSQAPQAATCARGWRQCANFSATTRQTCDSDLFQNLGDQSLVDRAKQMSCAPLLSVTTGQHTFANISTDEDASPSGSLTPRPYWKSVVMSPGMRKIMGGLAEAYPDAFLFPRVFDDFDRSPAGALNSHQRQDSLGLINGRTNPMPSDKYYPNPMDPYACLVRPAGPDAVQTCSSLVTAIGCTLDVGAAEDPSCNSANAGSEANQSAEPSVKVAALTGQPSPKPDLMGQFKCEWAGGAYVTAGQDIDGAYHGVFTDHDNPSNNFVCKFRVDPNLTSCSKFNFEDYPSTSFVSCGRWSTTIPSSSIDYVYKFACQDLFGNAWCKRPDWAFSSWHSFNNIPIPVESAHLQGMSDGGNLANHHQISVDAYAKLVEIGCVPPGFKTDRCDSGFPPGRLGGPDWQQMTHDQYYMRNMHFVDPSYHVEEVGNGDDIFKINGPKNNPNY